MCVCVQHLRVNEVHCANSHAHLLQLVDNIAHDGDVGVSVQEAVVGNEWKRRRWRGCGVVQFYLPWAVEYVVVILIFAEFVLIARKDHDFKTMIENNAHGGARGSTRLQPVDILNEILHGVHQAAIGPEVHLRHNVLNAYQFAHVNAALIPARTVMPRDGMGRESANSSSSAAGSKFTQ